MKVWLDVLTPKQANFLGALDRRLNEKGFRTLLTTREYREVNELLALRGLEAVKVGRHGGGMLKEKLVESARRVAELAKVVDEFEPDVAISFSSPEGARVSFGMGVPHFCVSDSPHAEAVSRLVIPLSQRLFTPWVIPTQAWSKYGISARAIARYRALDPVVWLRDHATDPKLIEALKIDGSKPTIIVRPPEEYAAYLTNSSRAVSSIAIDIVAKLMDINEDHCQIVVLPRYKSQAERFRKRFQDHVIVPEHVVDAVSLMQVASVFVGGGGTMTAEAALLGLPAISYYPGEPTFVDRFLINYGLIERMLDPTRVARRALGFSRSKESREPFRKKAIRLVNGMEDPLRVIIQRIFKK